MDNHLQKLQRLDYLDGWRGLAIALVLEGHFLNWLPLETGRLGVDIFFCLSGLLMSRILFVQRVPLPTFYKRRISRIAPAFITFVLVIYPVATYRSMTWTWTEFASTLVFLRTYIPSQPGIWGANLPIGHLWSLNVEEHCYIFMSLLVFLKFLRGREGFALLLAGLGCILTGIIYVKLANGAPTWGSLGTEVAASHLLVSSGYFLLRQRVTRPAPGWVPLVAIVAASLCYTTWLPWWSHLIVSPLLLAIAVNHLADAPPWLHKLLSRPLLRSLGLWSFSIYLWQQPFYSDRNIVSATSVL